MHTLDLAVIAAYLIAITWFGARFRHGQRNLKDYFLGGRTAPWWAISLSIVSAETSTLTILGTPALSFAGTLGFLTVCMDQVVNQTAIYRYVSGGQAKVPVVIFVAAGGGVSAGPQHSSSHKEWFLSTPGIKIVCPSSPADAKGLL